MRISRTRAGTGRAPDAPRMRREVKPPTSQERYSEIQTVPEKIKQRRAQLMIHSYLYYDTEEQLVSDAQWDAWSIELEKLQQRHPTPIGFYDDAFAGWTHGSGMLLPRDPWVTGKAAQLVEYVAQQKQAAIRPARTRRIRG